MIAIVAPSLIWPLIIVTSVLAGGIFVWIGLGLDARQRRPADGLPTRPSL